MLAGPALAADIGVVPKKLIVVDKLTAATKAKSVFVAKDPGVTKGAGLDPNLISVDFHAAYDSGNAVGAFVVPAGTANGWVVNKEKVAKYVNKTAPSGPTQAKVAVIKPGKLLKLVGKGLGDTTFDILSAGDPAGPVHTAYCVDNAGEINCHCSTFTGCIYKNIAADTGAKLVCKTGSADVACSALAPSTCDVFAQDCASGQGCYPTGGGEAVCATEGAGASGESCFFANDCQAGLICVDFGLGNMCEEICDTAAPACSVGICTPVEGSGIPNFGVCL